MILLELKEMCESTIQKKVIVSGHGVRRLIAALGMTQTEFAGEMGMKNRNQINMYLQGKITLTLDIARKIQEIAKNNWIHISLEDIYTTPVSPPKEVKSARRCQQLARERGGIEITLDEIFADDEGEDDGS